jgi:hypothetical protein
MYPLCHPGVNASKAVFKADATSILRIAVRVLEIEPLQRLKKIRGVAFRPQASRRLSRFGVYVPPVGWLSPSN